MNKDFLKLALETLETDNPSDGKLILIIDAMNLFTRNLMMQKWIDPAGYHCGGSLGSIISIKKLYKLFRPNEMYLCFEGNKSTVEKRKIYPDYKIGRNYNKLSPFKEDEYSIESPEDSKTRQIKDFREFLSCVPINVLEQDKVEGDEVIGFLCKHFNSDYKIIVSSDKDFLQFNDDKTKCYEPIKEEIRNTDYTLNTFGIHPLNITQCRSFLGQADVSDNIKGIKGFGEKTILKLFPFVSESKFYDLDYYFEYAKQNVTHEKLGSKYEKCISEKETVTKNYQLMNLKKELSSNIQFSLLEQMKYQKSQLKYDHEKLTNLFLKFKSSDQINMLSDWYTAFSTFQYN